jgi:hypothetical protein
MSGFLDGMFNGPKGMFTEWKKSETKTGLVKWSRIWDYKWLNVVIMPKYKYVFVTHDNKKLDIKVLKTSTNMLSEITNIITDRLVKEDNINDKINDDTNSNNEFKNNNKYLF